MPRLFAGLEVPEPLLAPLTLMQSGLSGMRWLGRENLHLTLYFYGQVSGAEADDLHGALNVTVAPVGRIALAGAGHFANGPRGAAIWAGVADDPALARLRQVTATAGRRAGIISAGKGFRPHITLGRSRAVAAEAVAAWEAHHAALRSEPYVAPALTLFESHLAPGGAAYEAVARYPLVAGPPPTT